MSCNEHCVHYCGTGPDRDYEIAIEERDSWCDEAMKLQSRIDKALKRIESALSSPFIVNRGDLEALQTLLIGYEPNEED